MSEQFQRLKVLVDSLQRQEWQEVLHQLRAGGRLESLAGSPGGTLARDAEQAKSSDPSGITGKDRSELERWQDLLHRLGLEGVQLPSDGTLIQQWREFLRRAEVDEKTRVVKKA